MIGSLPPENITSGLAYVRFAEIHQLKDDLPASAELLPNVEDLFGTAALREDSLTHPAWVMPEESGVNSVPRSVQISTAPPHYGGDNAVSALMHASG